MGSTANYSWPTPESTDLVKDGWEAIKDLGDAIDTTVHGLPGAGLVHIKTDTYSAVSSVNVDDVFSATYRNYLVIIDNSPSTTATLSLRFRVGGSDDSTSNYQYNLNNFTNVLTNIQTGTKTSFPLTANASVFPDITATIYNPFGGAFTRFQQVGVTPNNILATGGGVISASTSFTGFSLLTSTGTISGSIKTYGFED